jgi:hypothetical protein
MISIFLKLLSVKVPLLLVVVFSTLLLGVTGWSVWSLKSEASSLKTQLIAANKEVTDKQKELDDLTIRHGELVQEALKAELDAKNKFSTLVSEAQNAREKERQANVKLEADIRNTNRRLLNDLPGFASGNTTESGDNIAACRGRSQTLQSLLQEAVLVAEEATVGAEQCGTDLRAVLAAWPTLEKRASMGQKEVWQDISKAPLDGTVVEVREVAGYDRAFYQDGNWWYYNQAAENSGEGVESYAAGPIPTEFKVLVSTLNE